MSDIGQHQSGWKERAFAFYVRAAMWIPPWNLFWWSVGAAAYYGFRMNKRDYSGDVALAYIVAAPVTLPLLPFMLAKEALERRQLAAQEARMRNIATELEREMKVAGIEIKRLIPMASGLIFEARDVTPDQEQAYRNVFAKVIRTNPKIDPDLICMWPQPCFPLHKAWADELGLKNHGSATKEPPCFTCGKIEDGPVLWCPDSGGYADGLAQMPSHIYFQDDTVFNYKGRICRQCWHDLETQHGSCTSAGTGHRREGSREFRAKQR